jgi:lipoprotein-anchoring transpeptidase ErfK/SrfK
MTVLSRRALLSGASAAFASVGLAACNQTANSGRPAPTASLTTAPVPEMPVVASGPIGPGSDYASMYAAITTEPFPVPAIDIRKIKPQFLRQDVSYVTSELPGTIVVDPENCFLYHIEAGGRARRYGVGVGKQGFAWSGAATINSKQEWPDWYPPKEMIDRRPDIEEQLTDLQSGRGVAGGPRNPLGARAMYLWQNNKDTLYRIHGTTEPYSIGSHVSSGCVRMINQDAMDLYARVPVGTKVVVLGNAQPVAQQTAPVNPGRPVARKRKPVAQG